jgi:hypothetical protein
LYKKFLTLNDIPTCLIFLLQPPKAIVCMCGYDVHHIMFCYDQLTIQVII